MHTKDFYVNFLIELVCIWKGAISSFTNSYFWNVAKQL